MAATYVAVSMSGVPSSPYLDRCAIYVTDARRAESSRILTDRGFVVDSLILHTPVSEYLVKGR